jgi:putative ABC transport system permease protein
VKSRPDESRDFVQMYVPLAQDPIGDNMMLVRSNLGRADALTAAIRAAITRIDKDQTVSVASITTLEDVEWTATGRHRFRATLVASFAILALLLAMVGVFGTLAYTVQQRTRDFGVRRALGATSGDVMGHVALNAAGLIAAGTAIGLVLAGVFGRLITSMLFGVQPLDAPTFVAVGVVLTITAGIAVAGPAWRAARVDPARVLRGE